MLISPAGFMSVASISVISCASRPVRAARLLLRAVVTGRPLKPCRRVEVKARRIPTPPGAIHVENQAAYGVVMPSPETTSSTRRFSCRPAFVSLAAMGFSFPNPLEVMASAETPWLTR